MDEGSRHYHRCNIKCIQQFVGKVYNFIGLNTANAQHPISLWWRKSPSVRKYVLSCNAFCSFLTCLHYIVCMAVTFSMQQSRLTSPRQIAFEPPPSALFLNYEHGTSCPRRFSSLRHQDLSKNGDEPSKWIHIALYSIIWNNISHEIVS